MEGCSLRSYGFVGNVRRSVQKSRIGVKMRYGLSVASLKKSLVIDAVDLKNSDLQQLNNRGDGSCGSKC